MSDQAVVFFVEGAYKNLIRIGSSRTLSWRLRQMQSENCCPIRVIGVIPTVDYKEVEQKISQKFDKLRVHHNWFRGDKSLLSFIKQYAQPYVEMETELPTSDGEITPLLTVQQVAEIYKIHTSTVRRYVEKKTLPFLLVGKQLRFRSEDVKEAFHALGIRS